MPPHVVRLLIVGGSGDVPDVVGLTPSVGTSVAPRRRPVGGTAEPGPMPSGDVMPSGEGPGVMPIPPTCAKAAPQPERTAVIAIINKRVIAGFSSSCFGACRALSGKLPQQQNLITHADATWHGLPRFARCCANPSMLATGCGAHSTFLLALVKSCEAS